MPVIPPYIRLSHDLCSDINVSGNREWLTTNGLGGYASGTVAGLLSRSYHGLLVAALQPPVGRTMLVPKFEETVWVHNVAYDLSSNRWAGGSISPKGHFHLEAFWLEGTIPCWRYNLSGCLVEKRVWMEQEANTTYVQYSVPEQGYGGEIKPHLQIRALVDYRDHHSATSANQFPNLKTEALKFDTNVYQGLQILAHESATPFWIAACALETKVAPAYEWYKGFLLARENERGLRDTEDHLHIATIDVSLERHALFILSAERPSDAQYICEGADYALERRRDYENELISQWKRAQPKTSETAPFWVSQAVLAADQFVVNRQFLDSTSGKSLIAGYPWFNDWGRDAMISLPGLTLSTGRTVEAILILRSFLRFMSEGLLPNNFPDTPSEQPGYNTVDGTLFFINAIWATFQANQNVAFLQGFFPAVEDVIAWHQKGTKFGISVDPADGLLRSGEKGYQLTWMDARVGEDVITPRMGKPVEINALWYNALLIAGQMATILHHEAAPYEEAAQKVHESFQKFYYAEGKYLYDVIDGPQGNDATFRPNQIFAISFPNVSLHAPELLSEDQQQSVLMEVSKRLLTPAGLRSLCPKDKQYIPTYRGGPAQRDRAYHQGTVWAWLTGPYVEACLRHSTSQIDYVEKVLNSQAEYLMAQGLGTLGEIFDATPPFGSHGCPAQAWSIAELLRAWHLLQDLKTALHETAQAAEV